MTDFVTGALRTLHRCPWTPLAVAACLLGLTGPCVAQQLSGSHSPLTVNTAADLTWQQLSPRQKQALAPLATAWSQLTSQQRSKWIALSATFETLTPAEQATVHERMREWASLSTQERARARLNYSHLKSLSREERKAQWEAYQALSEEEKKRLQRQKPAPKSAAPVSRPQPARADRLVQPAKPASTGAVPAAGTARLDRKTLLPRMADASAPTLSPALTSAPASSAEPAASTAASDASAAATLPTPSE